MCLEVLKVFGFVNRMGFRFRRLKLNKSLVFQPFNNLSRLRITAHQFKILAALNLPTNRTVSYKVYIGCCSVKHISNGPLLYSPSQIQGEPSNPPTPAENHAWLIGSSPGRPITTNNNKTWSRLTTASSYRSTLP